MFFSWTLLFIIIFFGLILVGILEIIRFHVPAVKRFDLTFTFLAGIATFLICGDLYLSITSNARIEENRIVYNSIDNIQKSFLDPQRELLAQYPEGFFLYASMNPEIDFSADKPKNFDAAKRKQIEVYCALRIFQSIEDFLATEHYNVIDKYVWINSFLMWMQSSILQEHWKILSFNFSARARQVTENLIKSSNGLKELRKQKGKLEATDYDEVSKKFEIPAGKN